MRLLLVLAAVGPGLIVMLADTDAGSVVTAAQSGAEWGYRLVLLQIVLIPVLYGIQEITVRLGILTGRGHGALIRLHFGRRWALLSGGTLFVASVGALITEFAGIAGAGELAGVPDLVSVPVAALALSFLCLGTRYRRAEMAGIVIGALELVFIPAAIIARPSAAGFASGLAHSIVLRRPYLQLVAANIGAVIMPWMVFYQQQAVIDKGMGRRELRAGKVDTALGSIVTQVVMIAILVATAATLGRARTPLDTIGEIAGALVPFLGRAQAHVLFGLGMLGAATVAAIVVSVGGAWGLSEVMGWEHSMNARVRDARRFYLLCVAALVGSAAAVAAAPNLVNLSVDVQVMNAGLLPIVLGFLLALERKALHPDARMHGVHKWLVWTVAAGVMGVGLYAAVSTVV